MTTQPADTDRATREDAFDALIATVAACRRCPAMEGRRRVLTRANGSIDAPVLFIAEAPGRGGAERTGVPFSGDHSGRTFFRLLAEAGWAREDVFITNAALCNPQSPTGANRPPARQELANCRDHLRATLALVAPRVVVTLGAVALGALGKIEPHGLKLTNARGTPHPWHGRVLVPLYHPSPKVLAWFPYDRMAADFRALRATVDAFRQGGIRHRDTEITENEGEGE